MGIRLEQLPLVLAAAILLPLHILTTQAIRHLRDAIGKTSTLMQQKNCHLTCLLQEENQPGSHAMLMLIMPIAKLLEDQ